MFTKKDAITKQFKNQDEANTFAVKFKELINSINTSEIDINKVEAEYEEKAKYGCCEEVIEEIKLTNNSGSLVITYDHSSNEAETYIWFYPSNERIKDPVLIAYFSPPCHLTYYMMGCVRYKDVNLAYETSHFLANSLSN